MKAIVFGGSGFIGSHVAWQLILAGHEVTAPLRQHADSSFLERIGATPLTLDFDSPADIEECIAGHNVVYCCLANPRQHLSLDALRAVEVQLTGRIIAAARVGATRVVLLSTVVVYGFDRPPHAIDESWPPRPAHRFNRVALEREQTALNAAASAGIELVILRPANALGRRDRQMAKLFASHRRGMFPLFGFTRYRFSAIDARDVGRAMIFLGELPEAAGQTYLVKGYDTSWLKLKAALDKVTGRKALTLRIPKALARISGWLAEIIIPYRYEAALTRFSVEVMATHTLFDMAKIEEAGFRPLYGLEDSIRDCLDPALTGHDKQLYGEPGQ